MAELILIAGLSGAGRSSAADHLEDLGWFVIDNLPVSLMPPVIDHAGAPGSTGDRLVLVVGATGDYEQVMPAVEQMRAAGHGVRILFLDAASDVLIRRYEGTRRRHPLTIGAALSQGLTEAIEREREQTDVLRGQADVIIDTSDLNVHELRDRIVTLFGDEAVDEGLRTAVESFGYKHGPPLDADIVLDCRFLPNPHWIDELRPLTGLDDGVRDYVLGNESAIQFLARLDSLLELLLPAYVAEGKAYLTIALGCTGGRHRSVVMAECVAQQLRDHGFHPAVLHRDVER